MEKLEFQARLNLLSTTITKLKFEQDKLTKEIKKIESQNESSSTLIKSQETNQDEKNRLQNQVESNVKRLKKSKEQLKLINTSIENLTEKRDDIKEKYKASRSNLVIKQASLLNEFFTKTENLDMFASVEGELVSFEDLPKSFVIAYKRKLEKAKMERLKKKNGGYLNDWARNKGFDRRARGKKVEKVLSEKDATKFLQIQEIGRKVKGTRPSSFYSEIAKNYTPNDIKPSIIDLSTSENFDTNNKLKKENKNWFSNIAQGIHNAFKPSNDIYFKNNIYFKNDSDSFPFN